MNNKYKYTNKITIHLNNLGQNVLIDKTKYKKGDNIDIILK